MNQLVGSPNNSYKPITNTAWVRAGFVNYKKGCTRLAAASDKAYQLLAHGRWFSPGTPASSTNKTGCHDIAEILLKVALNTKNKNKSLYRGVQSYWWRQPGYPRRKPPTRRKLLTNFIITKCCIEYTIMLHTSPLARCELTASVVICTGFIGSCTSIYHTITATTAPGT